jgi:hypothetical protein
MLDIRKVIAGVDTADARSALYYVSRYIKQAEYFKRYAKDIFEDEQRSSPNDTVRELANEIISRIQSNEGMKAEFFSYDRIVVLLEEISACESELGPNFSEAELAAAAEFAARMGDPEVKRLK